MTKQYLIVRVSYGIVVSFIAAIKENVEHGYAFFEEDSLKIYKTDRLLVVWILFEILGHKNDWQK